MATKTTLLSRLTWLLGVLTWLLGAIYGAFWVLFRGPDAFVVGREVGFAPFIGVLAVTAGAALRIGIVPAAILASVGFGLFADHVHMAPLGDDVRLPAGSVAIVTGGNSGVGFATARDLVARGTSTVVIACRSTARCTSAAAELERSASDAQQRVLALELDIASLASVGAFVGRLAEALPPAIPGALVLINNAGFATASWTPPTADGLEAGVGAMHVGHWALTELLLAPDGVASRVAQLAAVRVVNVASLTHHYCGLAHAVRSAAPARLLPAAPLDALLPECLDARALRDGPRPPSTDYTYFDAKLANVLHALELPRRHARVDALAVDLGWVATNILRMMQQPLAPAHLGLMRGAELGVRPVVFAALGAPGAPRAPEGEGTLVDEFCRTEAALRWHSGEVAMRDKAAALWQMSARIADDVGSRTTADG